MQRLDLLRISLLASGEGEGTQTSDGEVCELGCEGATLLAEGIVQCPDGRINRVGGGSFEPVITAPACAGTEMTLDCTSDAECDAQVGLITRCGCVYACATDDDCAENESPTACA